MLLLYNGSYPVPEGLRGKNGEGQGSNNTVFENSK